MRYIITKKHSTKAERVFAEILKELKVSFRHRWVIEGKEIDFIVGILAIEIDGHKQDPDKNNWLVEMGFTPIHLQNKDVVNERDQIKRDIKKLCQTLHILGGE